jgi:DinB superfamily
MEELERRLDAGRLAMADLRGAVVSREPWPLSAAYGAEPESDWGPKEVLAHVAEMAPYWLSQIDAIIASPAAPARPTPFGRVATDPGRIERIGNDRNLPASELFERIDRSLTDVMTRLRGLTPDDNARLGVHMRLGEMAIPAIFERFIVSHVEDHVRQLEELLVGPPPAGTNPTE